MAISDGRSDKTFEEHAGPPRHQGSVRLPLPARHQARGAGAQRRPRPHPPRKALPQDVRRLPQGRGREAAPAGGMDAGQPRRHGQRDHGQRRQRQARGRGRGARQASGQHDPVPGAVGRNLQLPHDRQHQPAIGACLRRRHRRQRQVQRLLGVVEGPERKDRLEEPHPRRHRRDLRAPRLHLGREVVSLRQHAFRVPPGDHRARQAGLAADSRVGKIADRNGAVGAQRVRPVLMPDRHGMRFRPPSDG